MQLSRKKIILTTVLFILLSVFLVYYTYGQHLGNMIKPVMESAMASYTKVTNNPYAAIISDEYYNRMVHRSYMDFSLPDAHDTYKISYPSVRHWFTGAVVTLTYSYYYYQGDELKSGSSNVPVEFTLERQNGQWRVVDYYEAP